MTPVVVDADAVHCMRTFGLLEHVSKTPLPPLVCTGYVAHHELNPLASEVAAWEAAGLLRVESIPTRSPASRMRRALRERHRGIDKGETEMIAWILACSPTTPLVSCDVRARAIAAQERIVAWDVLDLVHEWLACSIVAIEDARRCVLPWLDDPKARWRPRDFDGLELTLRNRYQDAYLQPFQHRS
ncbi:MAG: hypothetical protein KDK70_19030 [Myxococcales bacterium]|nr:hypothetical protein [Myxococcales bacterium]